MQTNTTRVTRYVPIENREGATPAERWTVIAVIIDEHETKAEAMFIAHNRHKARGLAMTSVWSPFDYMPTVGQLEDMRADVNARQGRPS